MQLLNIDDVLMRLGNDKQLCATIFSEFVRSYQNFTDELQPLLDAEQWTDAANLAHRLKGVAANLGAQALSACAADLEKELKQQQSATHFPMLQQVLQQTHITLNNTAKQWQLQQSNTEMLARPDIDRALSEIRAIFDTDYGKALRMTERLAQRCRPSDAPDVHQLLELMEAFDIISARQALFAV